MALLVFPSTSEEYFSFPFGRFRGQPQYPSLRHSPFPLSLIFGKLQSEPLDPWSGLLQILPHLLGIHPRILVVLLFEHFGVYSPHLPIVFPRHFLDAISLLDNLDSFSFHVSSFPRVLREDSYGFTGHTQILPEVCRGL